MIRAEVVARAPLRISFGGGGTDLPKYYVPYGGAVVSAAMTRYCRVRVRQCADGAIVLRSRDFGIEERFAPGVMPPVEGRLSLAKAAIEWLAQQRRLDRGLELTLSADVAPGTGLGSSSAMAVALAAALARWGGLELDAPALADVACRLEIDRLRMPIGKQDQHASAVGGLNALWFSAEGVRVTPLDLPPRMVKDLSDRLLLFSTGMSRQCHTILRRQRAATGVDANVTGSLHQLKALALAMHEVLVEGNLDAFGRLLNAAWTHKKRLSAGISTPEIDGWYQRALAAGALGGKITGAGGGGHLLLFSEAGRQDDVRTAIQACGLAEVRFEFDLRGVTVLGNTPVQADRHAAGARRKDAAMWVAAAEPITPRGEESHVHARH
jgi:D-glycero-alpha-D-manno-heptose-7-phosphate kinase